MFKLLADDRVLRDPLYGYVKVEHEIVLKIIDTIEFQRLRRIKQLGGTSMVFHTAEHSRFSHSIGTYELARRVINEVRDIRNILSEHEKMLFMLSGLLHDIGHGPFSHIFEKIVKYDHEEKGIEIILSPNTEINRILREYSKAMPEEIANILGKKGKYPLIEGLISGQLDVDRLDYMQRDYYFTGAAYGNIDVDRIIRVMRIYNNQVCFKESGVRALEDYLMSRYQMYFQVYYHPTSRSYELMLHHLFKRFEKLFKDNYNFKNDYRLLADLIIRPSLETFLKMDDYCLFAYFNAFRDEEDKILKILADSLLSRKLFLTLKDNEDNKNLIGKIKSEYEGLEKEFFTGTTTVSQTLYKYDLFLPGKIMILSEKGLVSIDDFSKIIIALKEAASESDKRFFYLPKAL